MIRWGLSLILFLGWLNLAAAQTPTPAPVADRDTPSCTLKLQIDGAITPGSLDYFERGSAEAARLGCSSILLLINTPGGGLPTTRIFVERILASPIPVLCLVHPSGGHAGSAGAIILMACHVNGAEPATNIGAATPITATGETLSEDVRKKLIQDTVSWVHGLARMRGRNLEFAEKIVTEAQALDSEEAARVGAIDVVALDTARFLDFAHGRTVTMGGDRQQQVQVGALTEFNTDIRYELLQFLTDPQIAYILFMVSIALLYFEFTHPGVGVPGVLGGIGLIVSLMAFHQLNVWWGGVFLIALGLLFLLIEAFMPSFGALGVGGIVSFVAGSFLLYEPGSGDLPLSLILAVSLTLGAIMTALAFLAFKTRKKGKGVNEVALIDREGVIASLEAPSLRRGMVVVEGEFWRFTSEKDVHVGDRVVVIEQVGLAVKIKPLLKNNSSKRGDA